jgi:hypothetical protein
MARIRTIKPEFWTDESVGECSVSARLLFIASFNFADDQGGLDRSAKQLKAQAFPYDAIDCEPLVLELIRAGLFIEYEVADRKYLHIKGFRKHQKVEKPAKPRIPVYDESTSGSHALPEDSPDLDLHTARASAPRGTEAEAEVHEHVMSIKARYPRALREDWITGEKNARNLVLNGAATWPELLAGVERYAKLCKATGRWVLNPANFFGAIDRPWSQAWDIPPPKPNGQHAQLPAPERQPLQPRTEERVEQLKEAVADYRRRTSERSANIVASAMPMALRYDGYEQDIERLCAEPRAAGEHQTARVA